MNDQGTKDESLHDFFSAKVIRRKQNCQIKGLGSKSLGQATKAWDRRQAGKRIWDLQEGEPVGNNNNDV
jgi:hypothetical protein